MKTTWETVYLIGGGPSLSSFDFEKLKGHSVVAINDALFKIPWATALFSADSHWANHRKDAINQFNGERFLAMPPIPGINATFLNCLERPGISLEWPNIHLQGTSGYAAINLAILLGAKNIFLLGYDYQNAQKHWFGNYEWKSSTDDYVLKLWAAQFNSIQLPFDVHVYNTNPLSQVVAFPKVRLEDVCNL